MRKAGRALHPDDLAPGLGWESAVWWLYLRVQTQWRVDARGRLIGLDYSPAIAIIRHQRWNLSFALELLQVVERVALNPDEAEDGDGH